jgi:hypothetical protein
MVAQPNQVAQHDNFKLDVASFQHPLVQVRSVGEKGRGMLATGYIPRGTLVIVERALAIGYKNDAGA